MILKSISPLHFNNIHTKYFSNFPLSRISNLPEGSRYLILDESGLGIIGIAKVVEGMLHWREFALDHLPNYNKKRPFPELRENFSLSPEHEKLRSALEGLPFPLRIIFNRAKKMYVEIPSGKLFEPGMEEVYFRDGHLWTGMSKGVMSENLKAFLIEHNISHEEIKDRLKVLNEVNFEHTIFFYSPVKGLILPGEEEC